MKPSEFWDLTPAEFATVVEGFERAQRRKANESLFLAWHVAALSRDPELPKLEEILIDEDKKPEPKQPQTPEQMVAACKMIAAAYGGKIVEV